jgi:hypothetical protein
LTLKIPPCELPGQREPGEGMFDAQLEFLFFAGCRRIIGAMSTTIDVQKAANQAADGGEASMFGALFHFEQYGAQLRRTTIERVDSQPSGGRRRPPARNLPYNPLSTVRREPGILVHVIRSPRESLKPRNSSFLVQDRLDNLTKAHS